MTGIQTPAAPGTQRNGVLMTSGPLVAMSRKPRKYGQMLVMLLIVVAAVGAGGWLYTNNDDAIDVLMVAEPIAAGHEITEADMRTSSKPVLTRGKVAGVEGAVPVSALDEVFEKRAVVSLVPGQVLTYDALTSEALPAAGTRVVAVQLLAGRVPATLQADTVVDVVAVPADGDPAAGDVLDDPEVISAEATVYELKPEEDGSVTVTLVVAETDARQVAAYGAAGRVTLMQAPTEEGGG